MVTLGFAYEGHACCETYLFLLLNCVIIMSFSVTPLLVVFLSQRVTLFLASYFTFDSDISHMEIQRTCK